MMVGEEDQNEGQQSLGFRDLERVPNDFVAQHAATCKELDLTENCLTDFGNLARFRVLEMLVLDKNGITVRARRRYPPAAAAAAAVSVAYTRPPRTSSAPRPPPPQSLATLPPIPSLRALSLNNNGIDDLAEAMDSISLNFPNLSFLSLMRNPVSPGLMGFTGDAEADDDSADEAAARYRLYSIYRIPTLRTLDCADVTVAEREQAARRGQFMVTRKPKHQTPGVEGGGAAAAEPEVQPTAQPGQSRSFLAVGSNAYDGRHSEGNRFIVNADL
jgi:hypothetical protein